MVATASFADSRLFQGHFVRLRGNPANAPDASVIIPVNAQGDLRTVIPLLANLTNYRGGYTLEVILVINNYPAHQPPTEIEQFRLLGIQVIAEPDARQPGEVVIVSARALGVRAAQSEITIHFDADCHLLQATLLLDWYIHALKTRAQLAYTEVGYYGLPHRLSTAVRRHVHYTIRWIKRHLLGIPTTRGSNYAITRALFLNCYDTGKLAVDLQVGPAAKLMGVPIVYSSRPELKVLTSGRRQTGSWRRLLPYFIHRLDYNMRAIPHRWHDVRRSSWSGFDKETERRQNMVLPK